MIVAGAILFLLGAVSATPLFPITPRELIISKHRHGDDKVTVLPSTGHSSIIENYIQKGTNVFFKPQFVLSSEQMPPQLQPLIAAIEKDDCKTTYPLVTPVIVDEPLRVVEKEINGPLMTEHITEIKPAMIPEPVMPVVLPPPHGPLMTTIEHITEIKPAMIPEPVMPVAVLPPSPVLPPMELPKPVMVEEFPIAVEFPHAPMAPVFYEEPKEIKIPPPGPVLPPMEMPKLPVMVEIPEKPIAHEHIVPLAPVVELEEKIVEVPVMIPPGPVLPPMTLPNLPVVLEEAPIVTEVHVPEVSMAIPPGPVLPPVELPKLPVMVEHIPEVVAEIPCEHPIAVPVPAPAPVFAPEVHHVPEVAIAIPPGPVLPPVELPKLPVMVEHIPEMHPVPVPIPAPAPVFIEVPKEPVVVPPAPVLPPLEIPKAPVVIKEPMMFERPLHVIPSAPLRPAFEMPAFEMPAFEMPTLPLAEIHPHAFIEQNRFALPPGIIHTPELIIPEFAKTKDCVNDIIVERVLPKMEKGLYTIRPELPVPRLFL